MGSSMFDIFGLIGSFIIAAALVPQITKVYRTKSAKDISYPFVCLYITGVTCLSIYGIGESLWPIFIPSTLEVLGGVTLLTMKIWFDGKTSSTRKGDVETGLEVQLSSTEQTRCGGFATVLSPK